MRVTTKAVFDMETGKLLESEGYEYWGPVEELKSKKPSESEKAAQALQAQERAKKQSELDAQNQTLQSIESGTFRQNPLYQSSYNAGAHQIADSFDSASASTRRRAQMAGMGYTQPISQASEAIVDSQRARALSGLTAETDAQVIPTLMNTGQARLQRAGAYDPEYYFGDYSKQEQERKKSSGLWGKLATIGVTAAAAACWIAEALWGEEDERTHIVRWWLNVVYGKTVMGRIVMWAYRRYGQAVAANIREYSLLRVIFLPIFSLALWRARRELARLELNRHLVLAR